MSKESYSEQPIEPDTFKIVDEDFVKPYLANALSLKLDACGVHYMNGRNLDTTDDFAEYVGRLVADYVRGKESVRKYARQYNAFPMKVNYPSVEADRVAHVKKLYGSWCGHLRRTADNLLDAIQFAKAHQLIEDGCEKKRENLEQRVKTLEADLVTCEEDNRKLRSDLEGLQKLTGFTSTVEGNDSRENKQ